MKIYSFKSIARRGSLLGAAFALAVSSVAPFAPAAFADALNPLTDRSLTLSSSSPGWDFKDGSGNATYAPPNSGANGKKTGNTFEFKVSTDTTATDSLKAMTFQYCTTSAGNCVGPGNNFTGTLPSSIVRGANNAASDTAKKSDLEIVAAAPSEVPAASLGTYVNTTGLNAGKVKAIPAATGTGNNFIVMKKNGATWESVEGWDMTVDSSQTGTEGAGTNTLKDNQITLVNDGVGFTAGQQIKVIFFATDTNYITNPGTGAFFVKINTFNDPTARAQANVIDGGVTVANVMNQSIQITTKVLETMDFSVGTVDPYTLAATGDNTSQLYAANSHTLHGPCEPILKGMTPSDPVNTLQMGNENGEFSLETAKSYSTHSYWRLSSNSSAGATVYYSGNTLSNTVGDKIKAIGANALAPQNGAEQFGLAIANGTGADLADTDTDGTNDTGYAVNYTVERNGIDADRGNLENAADNATNGIHSSVTNAAISNLTANASWHSPRLFPLIPTANYTDGAGVVNANYAALTTPVDTSFAFDEVSQQIPVAIASQSDQVVDCTTAKMRYVANIAATTPAGIYTTKINYIAAPQY